MYLNGTISYVAESSEAVDVQFMQLIHSLWLKTKEQHHSMHTCPEVWVLTLWTRKRISCHSHLHHSFSDPPQAQEVGLVTERVQWYLPDASAMDGIFAINETYRDSKLAYDLRGTLGVRPCPPITGAFIKPCWSDLPRPKQAEPMWKDMPAFCRIVCD